MKNNLYKIVFDIVMFIILLFLYFINITGNMLHEIFGLILMGCTIFHLGYNYKWITKIRNFKLSTNLINVALLVSFILLAITGIRASHSLFTFAEKADGIYIKLHLIVSLITILLIGIHIFLHRKLIKSVFTKQMKLNGKLGKVLFITFILLSISFVSFSTYRLLPKILDDKDQNIENKNDDNGDMTKEDEKK